MSLVTEYIRANSFDEYYTNPELAERIVKLVDQKCNLNNFDLIIQPSAGNGSFLPYLPAEKTKAYDINPQHPDIIEQDFLELQLKTNPQKTLVIGNPPFGKGSKLAMKFLKKSLQLADTVVFILPKTFLYLQQRKVPLNFHLLHQQFISFNTSFYRLDGVKKTKTRTAHCIIQIYSRKEYPRQTGIYDTTDFQILKGTNNPEADIFIQQVVLPGGPRFITTNYNDIPIQKTMYYCNSIKAKDKSVEQLYNIFTSDLFKQLSLKYAKSLSFLSITSYVLLRIYYEYNKIVKNAF